MVMCLEAASALLKRNITVTLIDPSGRPGGGIESITRRVVIDKLTSDGLRIVTGTATWHPDGRSIIVRDNERQVDIAVDVVVLAPRYEKDESLVAALHQAGAEARSLPACESPRWVVEAMDEAAAVARAI